MNLLLIEPDKILGAVYKKHLQRNGIVVQWARAGQEAIVLADTNKPDVVILELQLPGHGGVGFLYEFCSYVDWQHIPIVLHTLASIPSKEQLFGLNIVDCLYKPTTSLTRLVSVVKDLAPSIV